MNDQVEPTGEIENVRIPWRIYWPRLGKWLWRGIKGSKYVLFFLFAALVVGLVILSPEYVPGCREIGMRWFGAGLQLLGFATVALGLSDAGKQFGKPSWFSRIARYFSEFPTRKGRIISAHATAFGSVNVFGQGRVATWPSSTMTPEEQLKVIIENLKGLHNVIGEIEGSIRTAKHELGTQITERFNELKEGEKEAKRLLEEAFVGGLHIEWWGIVLFVVGIILASTSPEIAYLFGFSAGCY